MPAWIGETVAWLQASQDEAVTLAVMVILWKVLTADARSKRMESQLKQFREDFNHRISRL